MYLPVDVSTRWCVYLLMYLFVDVSFSLLCQLIDMPACWCVYLLMRLHVDRPDRLYTYSLMALLVDVQACRHAYLLGIGLL